MKSINALVIVLVLFLVSGLASSSISLQPVFANLSDPCFGKHSAGCPGMACSNSPTFLSAHCCWTDIRGDKVVCQTYASIPIQGNLRSVLPSKIKINLTVVR